jgi:hypothetical protein
VIGYSATMHGSSEPDVATDRHVARSREVGGVDDGRSPDAPAATGADENEEFVGPVAGQDAGYSGETGTEARAEKEPR